MACGNCGPSLPLTYTIRFRGLPENHLRRLACEIVFSSDFGSGAAAICTLPSGGEDDRGPIASIVVTDGGSCYARLGRVAPTLTARAGGGEGALFSVSLTESADGNGFAFWEVASVSVSGGTGYSDNQAVRIAFAIGDRVEENAEVTLQVSAPDGIPTGTTVVTPGRYYREDPSVPAYLADVTVSTGSCSDGFGADLEAVIDGDPESETFGQIAEVTIVSGGSNYLCVPYIDGESENNEVCYSRINSYDEIDRPWVVRASSPRKLVGLCFRSCFGAGAAGDVDANSFQNPPADPSPGPIPAVVLTSGGNGYAIRSRTQPSLEVSGTGAGATFEVEFNEKEGDCGIPYWEIASVAVEGGNDDWTDGETLTVSVETDADVTDIPAVLKLQTTRTAPTIESWAVACGGGAGAQLEFEFDDDDENYWFITAVNVVSGGSGYLGDDGCPPEHLRIELEFSEDDTIISEATLVATANEGRIVAVHVVDRGTFYRSTGVPRFVFVKERGAFWRETDDEPYVADVVVQVDQERPSNGSDAVVNATIDTDIESGTFGQITALTLASGGSNYTLYGGGRAGRDGVDADYQIVCEGGESEFYNVSLTVEPEWCPPRVRLTLEGYGDFVGDLPCNGEPARLTPDSDGLQGEAELTEGGSYSNNQALCSVECAECEEEVQVSVEWCGMAVNLSLPIPGSSAFVDDPDGVGGSYLIVEASISCTNCGWALSITVCAYCAETNQFASDGFTATIPFVDVEAPPNGNYCPQSGSVGLTCFGEQFGIPCVTNASATVA